MRIRVNLFLQNYLSRKISKKNVQGKVLRKVLMENFKEDKLAKGGAYTNS